MALERDRLTEEIRDALVHLYDHSYLARNPLVDSLRAQLGTNPMMAVHKLRGLLLEAIESLRPRPNTPVSDAAWRPYTVLYNRYVLGKDLAEVERELGLSRRQIQREQQEALETIAILLEARGPALEKNAEGDRGAVWEEVARLASEPQSFDAAEQLTRAMEAVRPLAERHGVAVQEEAAAGPVPMVGDVSLFRQLLVAVLSFVVRSAGVLGLHIATRRQFDRVICSLHASRPSEAAPGATWQAPEAPESVLALAKAQNATLMQDLVPDEWLLTLSFPASRKRRIVAVVEDNADLVALYTRYLSGQGYQAIAISDARLACEQLAEIMPDVVVLDVMMPDVDGWDVLRQIKADPHMAPIPVIICSVLDEPELASSLGAQAYLKKPIRPPQLVECLVRLLDR